LYHTSEIKGLLLQSMQKLLNEMSLAKQEWYKGKGRIDTCRRFQRFSPSFY